MRASGAIALWAPQQAAGARGTRSRLKTREGNETTELGRDPLPALGHVSVPELQVAAKVVGPVWVHIEESVHATPAAIPQVEVCMDLQHATGRNYVNAAAGVVRIRDDTGDSSDCDSRKATQVGDLRKAKKSRVAGPMSLS